jgi:hypothetical protein
VTITGAAIGGLLLTVKFTAEPVATIEAATGLSLKTVPAATVELLCIVTIPTISPAPVMALFAAACVIPTTFGTAICAGPLLTVRFTAEPVATIEAATGLSLMTVPEATVELLCIVTVPTTRPAPVMALVAAVCVIPVKFGTATCDLTVEGAPLPPFPPQAVKRTKTVAKMQ